MSKLEIIKQKIYTRESIEQLLFVWRFQNKKIVFTNGCFDILHLGHIDYLSKAADCGNMLIVGVNSDRSVKTLNKGAGRPIQDEHSRAMIIASLHFVNAVIIFDQETPLELIKFLSPNVLVKGADYKPEQVVGADHVKASGGEVKLIPYLEGYSTSSIEKKIKG